MKLISTLVLIMLTSVCYARLNNKGKDTNPFANHDKFIKQYEDYLKDKKKKNKSKLKKKLEIWKDKKMDALYEKVKPLEDKIERIQVQFTHLEEKHEKRLETYEKALQKLNEALKTSASDPNKEHLVKKIELQIEKVTAIIKNTKKAYPASVESLQKNIDKLQQDVDQYYNWAGKSPMDLERWKKDKKENGHKIF